MQTKNILSRDSFDYKHSTKKVYQFLLPERGLGGVGRKQ